VVIPKQNMKDMDDIPESVKKTITFIPVENMEQVLNAALVKA
jgi:ATP-dependent Lon protease